MSCISYRKVESQSMKVSYVDIFIYLGEFEVCKVFYKTFDVENNAIGIKFIGKT